MSLGTVKEEPEYVDEVRADLSDLYDGHVVKKELVVGPVVLQPPDSVYNLNGQNGLANVKQEQADADNIADTPVSVKQESKWEAEEYMVQPKWETKMPTSHGEPKSEGNMPVSHWEHKKKNMLVSHVEYKCAAMTVFDEAVKKELLKCEADDCKTNGINLGLCFEGDPEDASSSHPADSTQGDGLDTKNLLQSHVKSQPRLSSRMRIQYETDTELKKTRHQKPKIFDCNYCKKRFSTKQGLINHIRTHTGEKPYKCKLCPKKFSDSAVLVRHRRMHEGQKPHACDKCGKKYSEKYLLKNHKLVHTGEMQYFCTLCPKSFVNSSNFRRHQRVHVHKYICDVCKRNFKDTDSLVSHIKYHMKPKPHACKYCGKRFGQSGHLNRHLGTHTGKREHTCGSCSKVFAQKASLTKHVSRKVCEKKR